MQLDAVHSVGGWSKYTEAVIQVSDLIPSDLVRSEFIVSFVNAPLGKVAGDFLHCQRGCAAITLKLFRGGSCESMELKYFNRYRRSSNSVIFPNLMAPGFLTRIRPPL